MSTEAEPGIFIWGHSPGGSGDFGPPEAEVVVVFRHCLLILTAETIIENFTQFSS